jgi:hypothetical protein
MLNPFFSKSRAVYEKHVTAGQVTHGNIMLRRIDALCMTDN